MNLSETEQHRKKLEEQLAQDRAALIRAAQDLQPPLRALDRAEKRVRVAAEVLPVIAWAVAELALLTLAARWARQGKGKAASWPMLLFQAWRAWHALRKPVEHT
jgi:hypothetical protein